MFGTAILSLSLLFLCGVHSSSPPLSDEEISQLSPDLQVQFTLPSHSLQPHHARVGFKHRFVTHNGHCHRSRPSSTYIAVDATTTVSDLALSKACKTVGLMVRHMSTTVFNSVSHGHGVGLFAKSEGVSIYPENHRLKDTPECKGTCDGACKHTCTFDGRKFDTIAGVSNSRSVVLDHNVLCDNKDPYGHHENILVHEFAHQIHAYMPKTDRNRLTYIFNYIKAHHTWHDGYGTENTAEYWAEATAAWFMTVTRHGSHSPIVGMNECNFDHVCANEMEARQWLKKHDSMIYQLLSKIYTNNRPSTPSGLKVCT